MGRQLDLDAAMAARDEALAETDPPTIVRHGRVYELTPVMYADAMDAFLRFNDVAFIRLILAHPEEADDFIVGRSADGKTTSKHRIHREYLNEIVKVWGFESGESSASGNSSTNGGKRSRRTSPPSTE